MTKRKAISLRLVAAAAVAALAAIVAGTASAGNEAGMPGKYTQGGSCPSFTTKQVFTPWSDLGWYFLGPAANFEGSLTGWTVKGAQIVSGNETYYVNSKTDSHSLSLPKNSTATTPSICVTLDTPDLRLFVKNTGSAATLTVNMTYTSNAGKPSTVAVAKIPVAANAGWTPTAPVMFLANINSILSNNNQTWVTFQFASNGSLQIDDFYVDPFKHH
jgi:hypothetical protein